MFGKKKEEQKVEHLLTPSEELASVKKLSSQRAKELIEANNEMLEDLRKWKGKFRELLIELKIVKAGAVSHTELLEEELEKAKKKTERLEREVKELQIKLTDKEETND